MPLSLIESQAITELANYLYDFLPGKPYPYADQSVSFAGIASSIGLSNYWVGGSKLPAITNLLEQTLEKRRERFCELVVCVVRRGIAYRSRKGNPITREDIEHLNKLITKFQFKIPELWDSKFLNTLPSRTRNQSKEVASRLTTDLEMLKSDLLQLTNLDAQKRGYVFERFLNELFQTFNLQPKGPFRLLGEQIDGSFELDHEIYLLEAKWQNNLTSQSDILVFRGKVEAKAVWARGLIISYSGFTEDGLSAYSRGRATNLVGVSGQDIFFVLDGSISLPDALRRKLRLAVETGRFYVPIQEIIRTETI